MITERELRIARLGLRFAGCAFAFMAACDVFVWSAWPSFAYHLALAAATFFIAQLTRRES